MENFTLLTGATGGLGNAFALECAKRGHNLVLTGTNVNKLDAIYNKITKDFPNLKVIKKTCDLSSEQERKDFISYLKENNINVNFLINNAGYIAEGEFLSHKDEEIIKIIRVNCEGTVDITQKIIKERDKNQALNIITISSLAGDYPMPYMAIYAATKAMLTSLMVALNIELKKENVHITTICPSGIPTTEAMIKAIESQGVAGKMTMIMPEVLAKKSLKACDKKKVVYVPKSINRIIKNISKLCSEKTLAKYVGKRWSKSQKKRNFKREDRNE